MVDRNIAYADQSRAAQPAVVMIGAIESSLEPENARYSHARTSQSPRSVKSAVCARAHAEKVFSSAITAA
jgi:hypothetical protein